MSLQKSVLDLLRAVEIRDREKVGEIISKKPELLNHPECRDKNVSSLLWKAMLVGDEAIVELLIEVFGADPNEKCDIQSVFKGDTFLHFTAKNGHCPDNLKIAEVLIKLGAQGRRERNVSKLNLSCAEMLLKNGARLRGSEWKKYSPAIFMFDINVNSITTDMLKLLLKYGLDAKSWIKRGENLRQVLIRFRDRFANVAEVAEILTDS